MSRKDAADCISRLGQLLRDCRRGKPEEVRRQFSPGRKLFYRRPEVGLERPDGGAERV